MSVEYFLKGNPELRRSGDEPGAAAADVSLLVVVQGISTSCVEFIHMGVNYKAELKDVVGLEETKNSSLGPKSARIALKRDAILIVQRAVSAIDVASSIPFGFEKLSPVSEGREWLTAREKAWLQATSYGRIPAGLEAMSGTFFTTWSAHRVDDGRADDAVQ